MIESKRQKKRVHWSFKRSQAIGGRFFGLKCKFVTSLFMFSHHLHVLKDDCASEFNVFSSCILVSSSLPSSRNKIILPKTTSFPSAAWQLVQKLCSEAEFATRVDSVQNHDVGCVNSLVLTTVIIKSISIMMNGSSSLKNII